MKDTVILEGKTYISAKRAAKIINYAQDYIGQLCRGGKLDCKMIGRSWFVTEESLLAHRENTIDGVETKINKVDDKPALEVKKVIEETIKAPVVSPIQAPVSSFKYETEKKSMLPELKKNVPSTFALPKNLSKLTPSPFVAPVAPRVNISSRSATISSSNNSAVVAVIVGLVAVSGVLFNFSMTALNNNGTVAHSEASIATATAEFLSKFFQSIGLRSKPASLATTKKSPEVSNAGMTAATTTPNGIGIFPATTPDADAAEKARIINTFSDEVKIMPDASGGSGVIKPVFQKTDGDDFVYVLVPVKEEKK